MDFADNARESRDGIGAEEAVSYYRIERDVLLSG